MSVLAGRRRTALLSVVLKAEELLKWTFNICTNENNFPKRYRWCVQNKIISTSMLVVHGLTQANYIKPTNIDELKQRQQFQHEAEMALVDLLTLINVSDLMFTLKGSTITFWVKSVNEIRSLLKAWMKSDKTRYSSFQQ